MPVILFSEFWSNSISIFPKVENGFSVLGVVTCISPKVENELLPNLSVISFNSFTLPVRLSTFSLDFLNPPNLVITYLAAAAILPKITAKAVALKPANKVIIEDIAPKLGIEVIQKDIAKFMEAQNDKT